jgi:hypothetical protein
MIKLLMSKNYKYEAVIPLERTFKVGEEPVQKKEVKKQP